MIYSEISIGFHSLRDLGNDLNNIVVFTSNFQRMLLLLQVRLLGITGEIAEKISLLPDFFRCTCEFLNLQSSYKKIISFRIISKI